MYIEKFLENLLKMMSRSMSMSQFVQLSVLGDLHAHALYRMYLA